eukprot:Protomagalhaensia_wolfi_Nauph_80__5698@NODE_674_length_2140_cov_9_425512_g501_i0_p1_GENE_NODE_674_length_2140_cov_9_425512_g501_i0NODE_674_length_2140_cov_9_425512_g501_i0_p1_ORF_typecomplete_len362_score58_64YL1/PF05764_13/1_8e04YL1/PF05764_13/0_00076BUD22/PF09073_10/0_0017DUF2169/PF09937_9/0_068MSP1_C/PF07462_11/3_1Astro_capsid_p/PF12226_8/3_1e03Astro_capsid_p/PF12226_8/5_3Amelogenin/PF02948_15/0_088Amelogenin/PF02948_15/1_8e04_NODE_674_length_2140_cov_9_425512_g501_i08991984
MGDTILPMRRLQQPMRFDCLCGGRYEPTGRLLYRKSIEFHKIGLEKKQFCLLEPCSVWNQTVSGVHDGIPTLLDIQFALDKELANVFLPLVNSTDGSAITSTVQYDYSPPTKVPSIPSKKEPQTNQSQPKIEEARLKPTQPGKVMEPVKASPVPSKPKSRVKRIKPVQTNRRKRRASRHRKPMAMAADSDDEIVMEAPDEEWTAGSDENDDDVECESPSSEEDDDDEEQLISDHNEGESEEDTMMSRRRSRRRSTSRGGGAGSSPPASPPRKLARITKQPKSSSAKSETKPSSSVGPIETPLGNLIHGFLFDTLKEFDLSLVSEPRCSVVVWAGLPPNRPTAVGALFVTGLIIVTRLMAFT